MEAIPDTRAIEALLRHADWLGALARRLVGDRHEAEDLLQDTWEAALRVGRAPDNPRGWLATILTNRARSRARSDHARREREMASGREEAQPGHEASLERAEAKSALLAHVLALDEPYRSTLVARYVDGCSTEEIARANGVTASTVRTRCARGCEELRRRLAGERGAEWRIALAPLVVDRAGSPPATPHLAATSAMALATKITVVCLVLLAGAWRFARGADEPGIPLGPTTTLVMPLREQQIAAAPAELSRPIADSSARQAPVGSAEAAALDEREQPAAATNVPTGALRLVLRADGAPLAGAGVWIADRGLAPDLDWMTPRIELPEDVLFARSDGMGRVRFEDLPLARFAVGVDPSGRRTGPDRILLDGAHAGYEYVVSLGTATCRGRILDDHGMPRAGVAVQAFPTSPEAQSHTIPVHGETTDDGSYCLTALPAGEFLLTVEADGRFDGLGELHSVRIVLAEAEERIVDFGPAPAAMRWSGRVVTARGLPFPSSPIGGRRDRVGLFRAGESRWFAIEPDGTFDIPVETDRWRVRVDVVGAPAGGFDLGERAFHAYDVIEELVVPGARLEVRPLDSRGDVWPGGGNPALTLSVRPKGHDYPAALRYLFRAEDGTFVIEGLEAGEWLLGSYPQKIVEPEAGRIEIEDAGTFRRDILLTDR